MGMIPSKTVRYGRNADTTPYRDDKYVRCWNCGFPCNMDRDRRAPIGSHAGDGIYYQASGAWGIEIWGNEFWGGAGETEPIVTNGCPLCGCLHYDNRRK